MFVLIFSYRPGIAVVLFFPIANGQLGGEYAVDLGIERTPLLAGFVQDLVFLHFGRGAQKEFVFGKAAKDVVQQLVGSVVKGLPWASEKVSRRIFSASRGRRRSAQGVWA